MFFNTKENNSTIIDLYPMAIYETDVQKPATTVMSWWPNGQQY